MTKGTGWLAIALLGFAGAVSATPVIDFTSDDSSFVWYGNNAGCENGCTLGYSVVVSSAITVNGLMVFDSGSNGLNNSHEVGLWGPTGTLLASASVGPGALSEASASGGVFRYTEIASLMLGPGTYFLGALYEIGDTDPVVFNASGIFSNYAGVAYGEACFVNLGVLSQPNCSGATDRYFGPSLRFGGQSVPEPGSLALLGLGLAGLGLSRRRKAN